MNFDLPTLGAMFALLTVVLGTLLLFSWALNREVRSLAWWGGAFYLTVAGMGLVSTGDGSPSLRVLFASNCLMALAYGTLYSGCRVFNGRAVHWPALFAGVALLAVAFMVILDNAGARLVVASMMAVGYSAMSAWELWKNAPVRLTSQAVAIALMLSLVVFNGFRALLGFSIGTTMWTQSFSQRWSVPMAIVLVTYMPTLAFVFLSMAKERLEYEHKQAALVDPLTGIPNRRAFLQNAAAQLARSRGKPVSCLVFDLDNFKSINDRYGHDVGDHILTLFGQTLARALPQNSFGRLGGEEFAAVISLPRHDAEALAERIRQSFALSGEMIRGQPIGVTVSIGCATDVGATVEQLLQEADIALYQAKAGGRNIVAAARAKR